MYIILTHTTDEPYNFNIAALQVASKVGVSVWIDFHRYMDAAEIQLALDKAAELGVTIAGMTRDNEPYVSERIMNVKEAYAEYTDARFDNMYWPAMYILGDDQPTNRQWRQDSCARQVQLYRSGDEGIEIHCYWEKSVPYTPSEYIDQAMTNTAAKFDINFKDIMVGEWSGKNQETFTTSELSEVIEDYYNYFNQNSINNYYQKMGADNDVFGVWNFKEGRPTPSGDIVKAIIKI